MSLLSLGVIGVDLNTLLHHWNTGMGPDWDPPGDRWRVYLLFLVPLEFEGIEFA